MRAAILLLVSTLPLAAQQPDPRIRVELAVEPQQVTVGEPFHAALRVIPPSGYRVEYGEVASGDTLQALEPLSLTGAETAGAPRTAVYPLVAWSAGVPLSASVDVRFIAPDGSVRSRAVSLQLPEVLSVLPADGEEIAPKPAKGLIGTSPGGLPWWWWLAILLGTLLAAWLAYRLLQRPDPAETHIDPREWALAQLDADALTLLEAGDLAAFYHRVSRVLRSYVHRLRPDLGLDLTTTELLDSFEPESPDSTPVRSLSLLLLAADRVKFARHLPPGSEAGDYLREARAWVLAYPVVEDVSVDRDAA